jgi:hypothetical protein
MTLYFVDASGNYLGGFDGATPPSGSVQVPSAPADGRQKWVNGAWAALVLVPDVISPRQFRQSLTYYGFRTNVENGVAASDQDTKDWYAFATQFERTHPKVLSMATQLGYTSAQIDSVWTYGANI